VQAADFAFGQFRFLVRLLLLHGRQSYLRCREVVLYAFYKNVAYVSCFVLFSFYSGKGLTRAHASRCCGSRVEALLFVVLRCCLCVVLWSVVRPLLQGCCVTPAPAAAVPATPFPLLLPHRLQRAECVLPAVHCHLQRAVGRLPDPGIRPV
jgi:hypothetical protein